MTEDILKYSDKSFNFHHKIDRKPTNNQVMHAHDNIEVFYFISGDCYYLVEGTKYTLNPGDIMLMRPLEAHHLVICSDSVPYERAVANIHPDLLMTVDPDGELLERLYARPLGTLNRFDSAILGHTYCSDSMQMVVPYGHEMNRLDLVTRVLFFLTEADRIAKRLNPKSRNDHVADLLIDYVNQNLFKTISLRQISDIFFLSQSQINRIFKRSTGSSIGQYIAAKRLLTARNRIRMGESAVRVSEECGYKDYSSFYRSYCNKFGCSPLEDKI